MEGGNTEIARRAVDVFNEGGIEPAAAFFDEDVEFHEPPEQPGRRTARGRDAVVALFSEFEATWAEHSSRLDEAIEVDDQRVLVLTTERLRGRDGIEITQPSGMIFTFRDGKVVLWEAFWDPATARAAANLG